MAEGIMRKLVEAKGIENDFVIDSAGTAGYHQGELPDMRMRAHAQRRGYTLTHRSRRVRIEDFYDFDLIIGMDDSNISDLKRLAPSPEAEKKIRRMTAYNMRMEADHIPDPYYKGEEGFEEVIDLLEDACSVLLAVLTQDN